MKIGIFTVSLPEYTPEEAIQKASAIGYDGLEWRIIKDEGNRENPSFWNGNRTSMTAEELIKKAPALLKLAKKNKIKMPSLGTYVNCTDLDAVETAMEAANAIGAKSLRVGTPGFDPEKSWADQIKKTKKAYAKVAALAEKYDVRALIETHMGLLTPTVVSARLILEGLSSEYTGIMYDPGNQVTEGLERYDMAINAAGEYLAEVHIKNALRRACRIENGTQLWEMTQAQLQFGEVCWPGVIACLKKAGYKGWLMMEDFSTLLPTEQRIRENFNYISGLL